MLLLAGFSDFLNSSHAFALLGGMLIGVATVLMWVFNAKITGVSGIVANLWRPWSADFVWQMAFVLGVLISPWLASFFMTLPQLHLSDNIWLYLVAGVLVGIGTRLGSGCTSGHGICGNARFSTRSLVATASFMLAGFLTVFIGRHLLHWI